MLRGFELGRMDWGLMPPIVVPLLCREVPYPKR